MGILLLKSCPRLVALLLALACAAAADEPPKAGEEPPPAAEAPAAEEAPKPEDHPPEVVAPPAATPAETPPATPEDEAARKKALKWEIDGYLAEAVIYRNASGEASEVHWSRPRSAAAHAQPGAGSGALPADR